MRILLQTVGTGGERHPVWEALTLCIRQRKPDRVVHLCSQLTVEQTLPKIRETLAADWLAEHELHIAEDADSVEHLMLAYACVIDDLQARYPEAILEVDYTSGTKAMSAAAVAAAVSRQVPHLLYGVGPRDASGRATNTEKYLATATDQLIAEPQLLELGRLYNLHQFRTVQQQTKRLLNSLLGVESNSLLRARALSLGFLSEVYELWDRFDWKAAYARIRDRSQELNQALEQAGWDSQLLQRQLVFLKACKKAEYVPPVRLVDLLANIQRCLETNCFDDAVARGYRAIEFLVQCRIARLLGREKHDNPTSKVPFTLLQTHAPQATARLQSSSSMETCNLGLRDALEVLAEADDPVGVKLQIKYSLNASGNSKRGGELKDLLDQRNNSWLAHGTTPISESNARRLAQIVHEFAQLLSEQEAFPFAEKLHTAQFPLCPWVTE